MAIKMFDIESTGLKADTSQIVAIGIKEMGKKPIIFSSINKTEGEVIEDFLKSLKPNDKIVSWYGQNFDMKFVMSRALVHGVDASKLSLIKHLDLWEVFREKFAFSSNKMSNICKQLNIEVNDKFEGIDVPNLFIRALRGDENAWKTIENHLISDLDSLEKIYKKVSQYIEF